MNEQLAEKMVALVDYDGKDRVVHFKDYLLDNASKGGSQKTFKSEFAHLDEKIGGLQTGEVVIVSGYTKNGKTLFAESWIHSMAKKDPSAKTAIFSFEVQTEKLLVKYMYDDTLPLYVPTELKTMDFEWLKQRCLEAKLKHDCRVILIDHLHFLVDMNTKQNMSLNIGAFMRRLKHEIALGMNMAVILIAHQGQPKEGKEADLGGIRDSSFVSQEADMVVIVSRKEDYGPKDIEKYSSKYGYERVEKLFPVPDTIDDKYSQGLAQVKVACTRRTGVFDFKKLFKKVGNFLEEV